VNLCDIPHMVSGEYLTDCRCRKTLVRGTPAVVTWRAVVRLNPSVVALVGVLLCCLFAKIEASARATGEAVPQAQAAARDFVVPVAVSPDQCAANC
jgi:hypothetical protein